MNHLSMASLSLGASLAALVLSVAAGPALAQDSKPAAGPSSKQLARLCEECAWVAGVRSEERKGEGSGLGAVGGAVVGGLLGSQIGGGSGKKIATVGGAVAGGMAGHEIEKRHKSYRVWIISLVNKDGSTQDHEQRSDPKLKRGDTVLLRDGRLQRR